MRINWGLGAKPLSQSRQLISGLVQLHFCSLYEYIDMAPMPDDSIDGMLLHLMPSDR